MKKLQNKKTGEIGYLIVGKGCDCYTVANDNWESCGKYDSLSKLNEEWQDYEEPELWWFIDRAYEPHLTSSKLRNLEADREIGNYFETKEEAEKAVEKLKAWKRLKDKGFRFNGYGRIRYAGYGECEYSPHIDFTIPELDKDEPYHYPDEVQKDLDILFGGEE